VVPAPAPALASGKETAVPKAPAKKAATPRVSTDHSSNYNVQDAIKKLRAIKSKDEFMSFIKGEKRLTVTRVIPAALNKL